MTQDLTLPTSHFGGPIKNTYVINKKTEEVFAICIIKLKSQDNEIFPRRKIVCITRVKVKVDSQFKYIMRARYLPWSLIVSILCVGPRIFHSGFEVIQSVWNKFRSKTKKNISQARGGTADEFTQGKKQGDTNYERILIQVVGTGLLIRFMSAFVPWIAIAFMVCVFFSRVNAVSDSAYYVDVYRRFRFLSGSIDNANSEKNKKMVQHALDKLIKRKWNYETGNVVGGGRFKETTTPQSFSDYFRKGISKIKKGCTVQVCKIDDNIRKWHDTTVEQVLCDNVIVVRDPDSNSDDATTMKVPYHRIKIGRTLDENDSKNKTHYERTYNIGERVDALIDEQTPSDKHTQSGETKWVEGRITKVERCKTTAVKYTVELLDTPKKQKITVMEGFDKIRGFPGSTEQSVLQEWFNGAMEKSTGSIEIEKYISLNSPFRDEFAVMNRIDGYIH